MLKVIILFAVWSFFYFLQLLISKVNSTNNKNNKYYKFKLKEEKYYKFHRKYYSCFRKNFYPCSYLFTYNLSIRNLFIQNNTYCFKKYKFVPNNLEYLFITECYDVFWIRNMKKFELLKNLWIIYMIPIVISGLSYLFHFSDGVGIGIFIFMFVICYNLYLLSIDEKPVKLSNENIIKVIGPFIQSKKDINLIINKFNDKIEKRKEDLISKKFDEITKNMNPDIVKSRKKDLLVYASSLLSEDKNVLNKIYQGTSIQDYDKLIDDFHIREEKRLKNHISYEGRIGVRDKRILKEKLGYTCQACGLKMSEKYGNIGANYIELHHKVPYSQLQENDNRLLNVNDFCVLCPNCHRMIHKLENAGDIKLLKEILKSKSE